LLDVIKQTPNARVVNISSNAHKSGTMNFDNLMFEGGQDYTPMKSYGQSKLANMLFTLELQNYFETTGTSAIAVGAHPGGSNTNLGDHLMDRWWAKILWPVLSRMMQSAEQGAWPTLRAATDPNATGNDYFGPDGFMEMRGKPKLAPKSQSAQNLEDAKKLWEISEELTGVRYTI